MNKSELKKRCKEIWSSYELRDAISEEDQKWLIENVFSHHPQWGWWRKQGVDYMTVGRSKKFGSPCFYIFFTNPIDNRCSDISWVKSIDNIK